MASKKKDAPSYSAASDELETILTEIESGEADVDELAHKVERAAWLIQVCREKLARTELQVRKAVADLNEDPTEDAAPSPAQPRPEPLQTQDDLTTPPFDLFGDDEDS